MKQFVNSPTLAYYAVYGKMPEQWIPGRTNHPTKTWRGVQVDEHLKDEWLEALNSIDGIEIRASCEGHDGTHVAFVVFRFIDPDNDDKAERVAEILSSGEGIYSLADRGNAGRMRIVVAGKTWYGRPDWQSWWDTLAEKISEAVSKVLGEEVKKMKLEEMTPQNLSKVSDEELRMAHLRVHQWYANRKNFSEEQVQEIIRAHKNIKAEMLRRGMRHVIHDELDRVAKSGEVYVAVLPDREINAFIEGELFDTEVDIPDELLGKPIVVATRSGKSLLAFGIIVVERKDGRNVIIESRKFSRAIDLKIEPDRLIGEEVDKSISKMNELISVAEKVENLVLFPDFVSFTGSVFDIENDNPNDIDVVIKAEVSDDGKYLMVPLEPILLKLTRAFPNEVSSKFEFILNPTGASWSYLPVFDLQLVRKEKLQPVMLRESYSYYKQVGELEGRKIFIHKAQPSLQLGKPFTPLKAVSGYHKGEFFVGEEDKLWELWAAPILAAGGAIAIQPKFDGIRLICHRDKDKFWIFTEDRKRDRAKIFGKIINLLKEEASQDRFIIDTEFVEWDENGPIPREEMMWMVVGNDDMGDRIVKVNIHDCLWYGEEGAIHDRPYIERLEYLDKLFPKLAKTKGQYLQKGTELMISPTWIVRTENKKAFMAALEKAKNFIGSEGAMLKDAESRYSLSPTRTTDWCVGGKTIIVTKDGFKFAAWIRPGDYVLSKDGKFHRVLRVAKRKPNEADTIYRIEPEHGPEFLITGNHEVLTGNGEWVSVQDGFSDVQFPLVEEEEFPDYPRSLDFEIMGYRKSIPVNAEVMRLFGFWVGDGSNNAKNGEVTFSRKDKSVLERYKKIIEQYFRVEPIIYRHERDNHPIHILRFRDPPLSEYLSKEWQSFARRGAREKTIPLWVCSLPDDLFSSFLAGLIEADGYDADRTAIVTSSASLAGRLYIAMLKHGYDAWIGVHWPRRSDKLAYRLTIGRRKLSFAESSDSVKVSKVKIEKLSRSHMPRLLYDFEIENENSYCAPYITLHNSKLKRVREVAVMIVGRMKKAASWKEAGLTPPKRKLEGDEALKAYKKLQEKSRTWIFRCALKGKGGKGLVPLVSQNILTKGMMQVKWNPTLAKPQWTGLEDPRLWEMMEGVPEPQLGEYAYANTYGKAFDKPPELGDIITVRVERLLEFKGKDGKKYLTWMHPRVAELRPERKEEGPDSVDDIKEMLRTRYAESKDR